MTGVGGGKASGGGNNFDNKNFENLSQDQKKQQLEKEKLDAQKAKQEVEAKKIAEETKQKELEQQKSKLQEQKATLEKIEKTLDSVKDKLLKGNLTPQDLANILNDLQVFLSSLPGEVVGQFQAFVAKIQVQIANLISLLSQSKTQQQGQQGSGQYGDDGTGQTSIQQTIANLQQEIRKDISALLTQIPQQIVDQKKQIDDQLGQITTQLSVVEQNITTFTKEITIQQEIISTKEQELQALADEEMMRKIDKEIEDVIISSRIDLKNLAVSIIGEHTPEEIKEKIVDSDLFKEALKKIDANNDEKITLSELTELEKHFTPDEKEQMVKELDKFAAIKDKIPYEDHERLENVIKNLKNILQQAKMSQKITDSLIRTTLLESAYAFTKWTNEIGFTRTQGGVVGIKDAHTNVTELLAKFTADMPSWFANIFTYIRTTSIKK